MTFSEAALQRLFKRDFFLLYIMIILLSVLRVGGWKNKNKRQLLSLPHLNLFLKCVLIKKGGVGIQRGNAKERRMSDCLYYDDFDEKAQNPSQLFLISQGPIYQVCYFSLRQKNDLATVQEERACLIEKQERYRYYLLG